MFLKAVILLIFLLVTIVTNGGKVYIYIYVCVICLYIIC
jgi:hypothetical protein